jgi:hypothetical protein
VRAVRACGRTVGRRRSKLVASGTTRSCFALAVLSPCFCIHQVLRSTLSFPSNAVVLCPMPGLASCRAQPRRRRRGAGTRIGQMHRLVQALSPFQALSVESNLGEMDRPRRTSPISWCATPGKFARSSSRGWARRASKHHSSKSSSAALGVASMLDDCCSGCFFVSPLHASVLGCKTVEKEAWCTTASSHSALSQWPSGRESDAAMRRGRVGIYLGQRRLGKTFMRLCLVRHSSLCVSAWQYTRRLSEAI